MSLLLIVLVLLLLFGGGGWGYSARWRTGVFGTPDILGILVTIVVIVVVLRLVGLF